MAAEQGVDLTEAATLYAIELQAGFETLGARVGQDPQVLFDQWRLRISSQAAQEAQAARGVVQAPDGRAALGLATAGNVASQAAALSQGAREGVVEVGGRPVRVVLPSRAGKRWRIVQLKVQPFDQAYSRTGGFYLDAAGNNRVGTRYERAGEFLKTAESMAASEVYVHKDGSVDFLDGRHRYAYLRDTGLASFPVAMDAESARNAAALGMATRPGVQPGGRQERPRRPPGWEWRQPSWSRAGCACRPACRTPSRPRRPRARCAPTWRSSWARRATSTRPPAKSGRLPAVDRGRSRRRARRGARAFGAGRHGTTSGGCTTSSRPTLRERAKLWYVGANRIATELADKHGVTDEQAAGVLAVLSPQMDWYKNVALAERVMEWFDVLEAENTVFTPERMDHYVNRVRDGIDAYARKVWRERAT